MTRCCRCATSRCVCHVTCHVVCVSRQSRHVVCLCCRTLVWEQQLHDAVLSLCHVTLCVYVCHVTLCVCVTSRVTLSVSQDAGVGAAAA